MAPRRAALKALTQVRDGRPFDAALTAAVPRLADPDRRLVHELAAGVLRHQSELDAVLSPLVPRGWKAVEPALQDVLRIGAFQLTRLDRVPIHAAVSTTVELAREASGARASGFVNAVLRKVSAGPGLFADTEPAPIDGASAADLAARYSHPEWLVARWLDRFGADETARLLAWNNRVPMLVLQPARQDVAALEQRWREAGVKVSPAPFGAGLVTDRTRPDELPGFVDGAFYVQDAAQVLVAWFADFTPGTTVLDLCAAPGGKALALGRSAGMLAALERHPRRAERLADNLRRAGSGREHAVIGDAVAAPFRAQDAVLLDSPCLGTGTFARHPDARWRVSAEALRDLAARQAQLLEAAAELVTPGGLLVYATCSLEPEENQAQVAAFLKRHGGFRREPSEVPPTLLSAEGDLVLLPQRHGTDGGFAARLRRGG
jgi:16S rRNA (cytosine967-C5)-methyltransferase